MVPSHIKCQTSHIHGCFGNITTEPFKLFTPQITKILNEKLLTMSTIEVSTIFKLIQNQISCCPINTMMVPRHIKCQTS